MLFPLHSHVWARHCATFRVLMNKHCTSQLACSKHAHRLNSTLNKNKVTVNRPIISLFYSVIQTNCGLQGAKQFSSPAGHTRRDYSRLTKLALALSVASVATGLYYFTCDTQTVRKHKVILGGAGRFMR